MFKVVALMVRLTATSENPFRRPNVYFYILAALLTGIWWDKQMNRGLKLFPAVVIVPIMQVHWTVLCVLDGGQAARPRLPVSARLSAASQLGPRAWTGAACSQGLL